MLLLQVSCDAVQQAVDRMSQAVELIARATNRQPLGYLARVQSRSCLNHLRQRMNHAAGEQMADRRGNQKHDQARKDDQPIDRLHVLGNVKLQATDAKRSAFLQRRLQAVERKSKIVDRERLVALLFSG